MEDVQEICRTCLRVRDDDEFIYIMNSADYTNPNRTYADILIDLGKLEVCTL